MPTVFRHANGQLPNVLAIAYTFLGWPVGVWMLTQPNFAVNVVGLLLVAHTLVFSGYLIHEAAHNAIFATPAANDRLGVALAWINGGCLAHYAGLKEKHLRHHADRLDVVTFDYRAALDKAPRWVVGLVLALEWAYVPVIELVMRGFMITAPFIDGTVRDRVRIVAIIAVRLALFAGLALISVKAVILYMLAYFIFLSVLRFMDAFQHTYDVFPTRSLQRAPAELRRDRQYEYENTYSNLVSVGIPWLNILVLNFPYHNAHHAKPVEPWYKLPSLHRKLYGDGKPDRQVMPCRALLASYHKHRVARVLAKDYGAVAADGDRAGGFIGAVGVSFLTAV